MFLQIKTKAVCEISIWFIELALESDGGSVMVMDAWTSSQVQKSSCVGNIRTCCCITVLTQEVFVRTDKNNLKDEIQNDTKETETVLLAPPEGCRVHYSHNMNKRHWIHYLQGHKWFCVLGIWYEAEIDQCCFSFSRADLY